MDSDGLDEKRLVSTAQETLVLLAAQKLDAKNYSGALKLAALCQSLGSHVLALEIIKSCHHGQTLKTNSHKPPEKEFTFSPGGRIDDWHKADKGKQEASEPVSLFPVQAAKPSKSPIRLPENNDELIHHILVWDDLFTMLLVPYWEEPEIIEKRYKEISTKLHPDRNNGSARSISAFAKLGSALDELKRNPIQYTMRLQIAAVKAGKASEFDLPRPEEKMGYGKSCHWGDTNGFDGGKRSYTYGVAMGGGLKKHVDMNPAAEEGHQTAPEQMFAGGGDASNWLTAISYNAGTAHRFDGSGQYQSFSSTGAAIARNGTRFDAKNN